MNATTRPDNRPATDAAPTWVRWIGDPPWAATTIWIGLGALVIVDLELLKPAIAKAVGGGTAANWIATFGIVCVMAGVLACAAELLMRFVERRDRAWLIGALTLAAAWTVAIAVLFQARRRFGDRPALTMSTTPTPTAPDDKALWAALVLSLLMTLTGLVAAALVVVNHDHRQAQRRRSARRRWMLATLHRWVSWRHGQHTRRTTMWVTRVGDLASRRQHQETKLLRRATSLEQGVRVRIATALAEPSATSGIFEEGAST